MKRIAIIGCGGINSWVVKHLSEIVKIFEKEEMVFVQLFDFDEVEEKNLLRGNQNFEIDDLMSQKAKVLGERYKFAYSEHFITEDNISLLENFDDIIMGVDNHKTRRLIYKYCLENEKYLLDLRAQGTQLAFFILDHSKKMDYYDEKFFNNKQLMERKGSCQLTQDVENDHIENANKIIAYMGIYGIYFKRLRGEEVSTKEWKFVY